MALQQTITAPVKSKTASLRGVSAGLDTPGSYMRRHHADGARELAMEERQRKEHAEYRKDAPGKPAVPLLSLRGSCKGLDTMDAYFERKHADNALEESLELV